MAKKIMGNFHQYVSKEAIPEEEEEETKSSTANKQKSVRQDFYIYQDLQKVYGKAGEDIFYTFLNRVYDSPEKDLEESLPTYL